MSRITPSSTSKTAIAHTDIKESVTAAAMSYNNDDSNANIDINKIQKAASADEQYQRLICQIRGGFPEVKTKLDDRLKN